MIAVRIPTQRRQQRTINWQRISETEWRAGNVRIIQCHEVGRDWPVWHVKLKVNGRWQWAYSSQRPWGYGSAGQAKRGVSKWKKIQLYSS